MKWCIEKFSTLREILRRTLLVLSIGTSTQQSDRFGQRSYSGKRLKTTTRLCLLWRRNATRLVYLVKERPCITQEHVSTSHTYYNVHIIFSLDIVSKIVKTIPNNSAIEGWK